MNKKLSLLFARRSVRTFVDRPVPDAAVRDLLEAAMAAPSACAADPWRFIVVRDQALRDRIADGLPNGQMLRNAAVGIVVCGDLGQTYGKELSYMLQDCSAAIENLLLAAAALGLGACWLGVHPRQDRVEHLRSLFNLSTELIPVSVIAVGWPAEQPEPRTRFNEEYVRWEK